MTPGKGIPFVDLVTPHLELEEELMEVIRGVIRTAGFIGGPVVEKFEKDFAQYSGAKHCVAVSSGTDALRFALMAAGVGRGDIVLTVANTFAATVEAILQAGATPHFVDIDPDTYNLSPASLREYLENECERSDETGSTVHRATGLAVKAIMPVHLYGQMADMDALTSIGEEYGLLVFEDACQAHGAEYFSAKKGVWQRAGSIGTAAAFSFYPGKNLGACGEAGAVTTNDATLAQTMRMIRDHGQSKKYHHAVEGYNGRLDALQAAILNVKMKYLDEWTRQRQRAAEEYASLFQHADEIEAPVEPTWSRGVYHLYVVRAPKREELQKHLTEKNIGTGLHYPIPLHLQPAYAHLGFEQGDLPITEKAAGEILSLPMYPQLRAEQQEYVAHAILQFYKTQTVDVSV
jgi:dTDP-4-amino-4,6-dideoxygalactose transaminase